MQCVLRHSATKAPVCEKTRPWTLRSPEHLWSSVVSCCTPEEKSWCTCVFAYLCICDFVFLICNIQPTLYFPFRNVNLLNGSALCRAWSRATCIIRNQPAPHIKCDLIIAFLDLENGLCNKIDGNSIVYRNWKLWKSIIWLLCIIKCFCLWYSIIWWYCIIFILKKLWLSIIK